MKYHRLLGLPQLVYFLTSLEAGRLTSKCQQCWFLLELLSLACRWPPFLYVFPLCASVSEPLLKRTPNILDWGPPIRPYFALVTSLKASSPKIVPFWGIGGQNTNIQFWGGHNSAHNKEGGRSYKSWKMCLGRPVWNLPPFVPAPSPPSLAVPNMQSLG